MIPKNIFLVWFGNHVPFFIKKNVQRYAQLNSGFNICFIHRTLVEVEHIKKGYVHNFIDGLISRSYKQLEDSQSSRYQSYLNEVKKNIYANSVISLSDIFRLELLNTFGGIYVDCDVFQLRPFDDGLLQARRFVVKVHHTKSFFSSDNFFMGSIPQSENDYLSMPYLNPVNCKHIVQTIDGWRKNIQYILNKKYFYSLEFDKIVPAFNDQFYIEHYTTHNN